MIKTIIWPLFCLVGVISYKPLLAEGFGISDLLADTACAVLAVDQIKKCANHFNNEINTANEQLFSELQYRKYCCSFNHLKSCVMDAIGDQCGRQKDSVVDKIVSMSVSAVKKMSVVNCDKYSGTSGSVLCLNDLLLIGLLIGLIALFLFVCGVVCKGCGSGGRKGQTDSTHFLLIPQNKSQN